MREGRGGGMRPGRAGRGARGARAARAAAAFDGIRLAARFEACCAARELRRPPAGPGPLLPPQSVVAALMGALQRPDYPEAGAGVRACFAFCEPRGAAGLLPGEARLVRLRRDFAGGWVDGDAFRATLEAPPFNALMGCEEWRPCSEMPRFLGGDRAAQAVRVTPRRRLGAARAGGEGGAGQGGQGFSKEAGDVPFTFFLQRIDTGPFSGCWLSSGAAPGDLAGA